MRKAKGTIQPEAHREGTRSVGIKCSTYDLLIRLTNKINLELAAQEDNFRAETSLGGVTEYAIKQLAKSYSVK